MEAVDRHVHGQSWVLRFGLSQDAVDSSFPDPELSGDDRSGGAFGHLGFLIAKEIVGN